MKYRRMRAPGGSYFFTVVTAGRRPLFRDQTAINHLNRSIAEVCARHPFTIDAYVILPDHLHTIWTLPETDCDFSTRWMLIKSRAARLLRSQGTLTDQPVWQNRFWEHLIHDDRDDADHIEYIHYNPVKHGLVAAPREWPHSSFHDFVGRGDYAADWGSSDMPKWPDEMVRRSE
jgi:putative transposase